MLNRPLRAYADGGPLEPWICSQIRSGATPGSTVHRQPPARYGLCAYRRRIRRTHTTSRGPLSTQPPPQDNEDDVELAETDEFSEEATFLAPPSRHTRRFATLLANAFLSGPWQSRDLASRGRELLGDHQAWLPELISDLVAALPEGDGLAVERLAEAIHEHPVFRAAFAAQFPGRRWRLRRVFFVQDTMGSSRAPLSFTIPALTTTADLATWLSLSHGELDGHADLADWHRKQPQFDDYRRWRRGKRLIEAPKDRLRRIQRQILRQILMAVPVHEAAHGFCKGRSPETHASLHVGQRWLARIDLSDFFPSIPRTRVRAVFRSLGYPPKVARILAALCTTTAHGLGYPYGQPHLPQGAPSSPQLANLVAWSLDVRLTAIASAWGLTYSRYADDLTFSGDRIDGSRIKKLCLIIREAGFRVNHRKTVRLSQARQQRVTGLVVNHHVAVPRARRRQLEAILFNCVKHGPATQNRAEHPDFRAHLVGRIAQIEHAHPRHGARLQQLFSQIVWNA